MQGEAVGGDGLAQVLFQLSFLASRLVHVGIIEPPCAGFMGLGFVESDVGGIDQRICRGAVFGCNRDTHAGADRQFRIAQADRLAEACRQSRGQFPHGGGLVTWKIGNDRHELVSSQPGDMRSVRHGVPHALREFLQNEIAGCVAARIIYSLEIVQIDVECGQWASATLAGKQFGQMGIHRGAIVQTRQGVMMGEPFEVFLLLARLGGVGHNTTIADKTTGLVMDRLAGNHKPDCVAVLEPDPDFVGAKRFAGLNLFAHGRKAVRRGDPHALDRSAIHQRVKGAWRHAGHGGEIIKAANKAVLRVGLPQPVAPAVLEFPQQRLNHGGLLPDLQLTQNAQRKGSGIGAACRKHHETERHNAHAQGRALGRLQGQGAGKCEHRHAHDPRHHGGWHQREDGTAAADGSREKSVDNGHFMRRHGGRSNQRDRTPHDAEPTGGQRQTSQGSDGHFAAGAAPRIGPRLLRQHHVCTDDDQQPKRYQRSELVGIGHDQQNAGIDHADIAQQGRNQHQSVDLMGAQAGHERGNNIPVAQNGPLYLQQSTFQHGGHAFPPPGQKGLIDTPKRCKRTAGIGGRVNHA